jgi:hypothetical protein
MSEKFRIELAEAEKHLQEAIDVADNAYDLAWAESAHNTVQRTLSFFGSPTASESPEPSDSSSEPGSETPAVPAFGNH